MAFSATFAGPTVGLDIGSGSIKAVALKKARRGYSLLSQAEVPVKQDHGLAADPMAISEAIRQTFDTLKLKRPRVAAALSGQAVIVKRLSLPTMSTQQLAEALPFEAEQYVPFDLADVQLDFQIMSKPGDGSQAMDVILVAAKRDRIDDRTAVISQAGQRAVVLDLEAFALANAYQMNYPDRVDPLAVLLHVGRHTSVVCVLERGQVAFTRDIPMGSRAFADALQREFGVDPDTADRLMTGQGPAERREQVAGVVRDTSGQLVLEVKKSVDFYRATAPIEKVSRMVLSGGACRVDGLAEQLAAEFSAEVDVFDPFRRVTRAKRAAGAATNDPAFAVAVGLAMRREGDR